MLPALISAGANILGGILGNSAQKDANKAAQRQADQEAARQREFAQSGIQWKVEDAKKAGIHPLYALGANTVSYSPQTVGQGASNFDWIGQAGQNIGRAVDATRSNPARMEALALTASQIQLEGLRLDNDLKRTQLASAARLAYQPGTGPGLPSGVTGPAIDGLPGQGDAPQIDLNVKKNIAPIHAGRPAEEYGAAPEVAWYNTGKGIAPQVPQSLSESFEQDWPSFYQWYKRHKIDPAMGKNYAHPPASAYPLGRGKRWYYDWRQGQWQQKGYLPRQRKKHSPGYPWNNIRIW